MITQSPGYAISDLSAYVSTRMGLSFPRESWGELERKIAGAAHSLGFADAGSCIRWMLSTEADRRQLEILASHLTVGETYFFRDPGSFRALTERVLPEIISGKASGDKRVRIWSAGCSTGEEPYSIAMVLSDFPALRDWDVTILATDINQAFLRKAEAGIYTEWSFRGVAPGIRERFFHRREGATLEILPALKSRVTFAYLNLIEDVYPALLNNTNAIDLVFCRNVLMYFTPGCAHDVVSKVHASLLPEGWFLVGPVEAPLVAGSLFVAQPHSGALLRKREKVATRKNSALPVARKAAGGPGRRAPSAEADHTAAKFDRARQLYRSADYDGVIRILDGLGALPGSGASLFQLLARANANAGHLAAAEEWCLRAIAADTVHAGSHYLLALIRIERQSIDLAMSALRKAIYLEPDFVVAHFTLANLYRRKCRDKDSERHLGTALRILQDLRPEEELAESEGLTAGSLADLILAMGENGGEK